MLAGLICQVVSLSLFALVCGDFAFSLWKAKSMWNPQYFHVVHSRLFKSFLIGKSSSFPNWDVIDLHNQALLSLLSQYLSEVYIDVLNLQGDSTESLPPPRRGFSWRLKVP
jgi:hypothetical protein